MNSSYKYLTLHPQRKTSPHFFAFAFPFPLLLPAAAERAFLSSTYSFIMSCKSGFFLASSSTSSVVTVVRPAWLENVSRSMATFSGG